MTRKSAVIVSMTDITFVRISGGKYRIGGWISGVGVVEPLGDFQIGGLERPSLIVVSIADSSGERLGANDAARCAGSQNLTVIDYRVPAQR